MYSLFSKLFPIFITFAIKMHKAVKTAKHSYYILIHHGSNLVNMMVNY